MNTTISMEHKTSDAIHEKTEHHLSHPHRVGRLPMSYIIRIAIANILHTRSRTLIATAAMAVGIGAVVLLVSFGYGLQHIIVQRLLRPNSLRLADVQSSSTALTLSSDALTNFKKLPYVEDVAASISLAGSLGYGNLKTEVVVIALTNNFLDLSSVYPLEGHFFSKEAEQKAAACRPDEKECGSEIEKLMSMAQTGQVAGASVEGNKIQAGQLVKEGPVRFRIKDDVYIPLRSAPKVNAPLVGYVTGSLFKSYQGKEVWGGTYDSIAGSGKAYQDTVGDWWGRWIKTTLPLHTKIDDSTYAPSQDASGGQQSGKGYLDEGSLQLLSAEQVTLERQMDELEKRVTGKVLGEASVSSVLAASTSAAVSASSTDEAALRGLIFGKTQADVMVKPSVELGVVEVKKLKGHEVVVSTGFLNALKLKPKDILQKELTLEYIVGGGQITGVAGRVLSKPVKYTVVGVIRDDNKSVVYTPLADVESIGIKKYTLAKILVKDAAKLKDVREKIQSFGFITQSLTDTLIQIDKLFRLMRFLLGAFGAIALIVAIFGMFNTLTVSLLERTREIGVMKTLGTRDSDVVKLFMVESAVIALFGGIFGIILGIVFGDCINFITGFFRDDKTVSLFDTPPLFIIGILVFAVIIGVLTGLYPSLRSRTISALDALRYE